MRKSKKRSRSYTRRPRKQKTYAEIMLPKPNELAVDTGEFGIVLETYDVMEDQRLTVQELMDKFYRLHTVQTGEYWKKRGRALGEKINPIVFNMKQDSSGIADKYWMGVYYGNFYMFIYRSPGGLPGPHSAQLWYQSYTTKTSHWIATLQIMAFFFNEEEIKTALVLAIDEKEWYVAPSDAKRSIVP